MAGPAETTLIIKKSRFIAHVRPATSEEEALAFVEEIRKQHWQATHNVPAYSVGLELETQRASDDGEPSGTAGRPVLEVIKKANLRNVAIVVTRYFGGTLLGAAGLIRAYGQAASDGIATAGVIRRWLHRSVLVSVDYPLFGRVQKEIERQGLPVEQVSYLERVTMQVAVPVDEAPAFRERIINLTNAQVQVSEGGEAYRDSKL